MNKVDQYAKRSLGVKYYVRYMDDIIIIAENKEKATEIKNSINVFIRSSLNLDVNKNKTKIFPINQGVNAIGFKIYTTHRLLRNNSKKKIKRKAGKMRGLIVEGKMTKEKAEQILNSWEGHAENGNSYNFINKKLIEKHDYIYMDSKGSLKVDMDKINRGGEILVI